MRTFVGALPLGNYNFGSGVFLCDEGTPLFVTYEIAKMELNRWQSEYSPNFLRIKKPKTLYLSGFSAFFP